MKVAPKLTVVPDGVSIEHGIVRISVAAVPIKDEHGAFDLEQWPLAAAHFASALSLHVRAAGTAGDGAQVSPLRFAGPKTFGTALWTRIFNGDFQNLWNILTPADERLAADQLIACQPGAFAKAVDDLYAQVALQSAMQSLNALRGFRASGPPGVLATNDALTSTLGTNFWRTLVEDHGLADPDQLAPGVAERVADVHRALAGAALSSADDVSKTTACEALLASHRKALETLDLDSLGLLGQASRASLQNALGPLAEELVRMESRWGNAKKESSACASDDEDCWDPIDEDEKPEAVAERKLAGILAYPTLAKYLGLILDFEFKLDVLAKAAGWTGAPGLRRYGELAASVGEPGTKWTAFVLSRSYFGPCGKKEHSAGAPNADSLFNDGLLNLGAPGRFRLTTLDAETTSAALLNKGRAVSASERAGRRRDEQSTKLPSLNGRGIALVDDHPELNAIDSSTGDILYAEDLLSGYRVDAAIAHPNAPGQWRDTDQWRPLMARSLTFEDLPAGFQSDSDVASRSGREHAHARTTFLHEEDRKGKTRETKVTPISQIVRWKGGSLALTSPDETDQNQAPRGPGDPDVLILFDSEKDLAVNITARLPPASEGGLLPLRDNYFYMVGARLVFLNGCSLDFEEARSRYVSDIGMALGATADTPFHFARRDEIPAPELLIPEDAPLAVEDKMERLCGETLETLVVRSHTSSKSTPKVSRFLIPPRTEPALAEQGAMFDKSSEDVPSGALSNFMTLSRPLGDFPLAVQGKLEFPSKDKPDTQIPRENSRGPVAQFRGSGQPDQPYYPDPWASAANASFKVDCDAAPFFEQSGDPFLFWRGKEANAPLSATPILLELEARTPAKSKRGQIFDRRTTTVLVEGAGHLSIDHLRIALAPAETADLMLWSAPDPKRAATHATVMGAHAAAARLHRANRLLPMLNPASAQGMDPRVSSILKSFASGKPEKALGQMLAAAPMSGLNQRRIVRLIHAVEKPLEDPAFIALPELQLKAVVIRMRPPPEDGSSQAAESWRQFVKEQGESEPLSWKSEEQGSVTFFTGTVAADRPSTGRVRCEAEWLEETANALVRKDERWIYAPAPNKEILFTLKDIVVPSGARSRDVSVLRDDVLGLRPNGFSFKDGRARCLTLRLFAASRFRSYFPGGQEDEDSSRFERPSSTATLTIPCTYRPPKVEVDRVLPRFRYKITPKGRRVIAERTSWLRIYCAPDWPATGCGEALAVVCAGEEALNTPIEPFVSRTGQDPVHQDDAPDYAQPSVHWIGQGHFRGVPGKDFKVRPGLPLRVRKDEEISGAARRALDPQDPKVTAIVFEKTLSEAEGRWRFDLPLEAKGAYFPFVQLGLSRYQPNAARDELILSEPVSTFAQVPPHRRLEVEFVKPRHLEVSLTGPVAGRLEQHDELLTSTLTLRLLRALDRADSNGPDSERDWAPVLGKDGKPIELRGLQPAIENGVASWSKVRIERPAYSRDELFGLLVEEIEHLPLDIQDMVIEPCPQADGGGVSPGHGTRGPVYSQILEFDDRGWNEFRREF